MLLHTEYSGRNIRQDLTFALAAKYMFSPFVTYRNNINILKKHTAVAHPKYIISQGIPNLDSAPGETWLNVPGKSETMSGVSMRDLRACMVCSIVQRLSVCLLLLPCPPPLNPSRTLLPQFVESTINPILTSSPSNPRRISATAAVPTASPSSAWPTTRKRSRTAPRASSRG
jgi:hypothetical protein